VNKRKKKTNERSPKIGREAWRWLKINFQNQLKYWFRVAFFKLSGLPWITNPTLMKKPISFTLPFISFFLSLQAQKNQWMLGPFLRPEDSQANYKLRSLPQLRWSMTGKKMVAGNPWPHYPQQIAKDGKVICPLIGRRKNWRKGIGGILQELWRDQRTVFLRARANRFLSERWFSKGIWNGPGGTEGPRIVEPKEGLYVRLTPMESRGAQTCLLATSQRFSETGKKTWPIFKDWKDGNTIIPESKSGQSSPNLKEESWPRKIDGK